MLAVISHINLTDFPLRFVIKTVKTIRYSVNHVLGIERLLQKYDDIGDRFPELS